MRHKKKRKLNSSGLFSNEGEVVSTRRKLKHKLPRKRENGSGFFPNVAEWTRLDWLQHRQSVSKIRRFAIDYGMSKLLTEEAVEHPLIKSILEDQAELPPNETQHNWAYLLNFSCAAGSEKSVTYILKKLMAEDKKRLMTVLSGNTPLCYAASSGNMSLCQKLMSKPYNCKIDFDVMRYARLSGNMDFIHDFFKFFETPELRSPEITL